MTEFITIEKAAELLNRNAGSVRRKCIAGGFIGSRKEKGQWFIPITAHEKFRQPDRLIGSDDLSHLPALKRERALQKLGVINACEDYAVKFVRDGKDRSTAIKIFAAQSRLSWQTLYRWMELYRKYGLMGLVDSRGSSNIAEPIFSPEASNELLRHYLTPNKKSLKQCYQIVLHLNKDGSKGWQIPALRTVHKWVEKNVPEPVIILHRQGKKAYEALCAPYIQTDVSDVAPGSYWIGDHHQFDFWIRYKNQWIRPWVTMWMDMRSRAMVGWYISPNPNQTTVLISMRSGIEKYGPPDAVKIDNGKDYDSQMFTGITKSQRKAGQLDEYLVSGIYGAMNITASFAQPYHPQAKAVERLFATIESQFGKTFETYCGKNPENRPEDLKDKLQQQAVIDRALDFTTLTEKFAAYVDVYNNTAHSGNGMDGRTPQQVMNMRLSKRVISSDILDMLMCVWSGKLTVGKNGIRFKGLLYGQYEPRLLQYFGKDVRVAYNPHDIRMVTVYDYANLMNRLCIAEQNQLVKYNQEVGEETLREAIAKKSAITKAHKNWIDARGEQYMSVTDLTIKALADSTVEAEPLRNMPSIRPVKTPLDLHLDEYLQEKKQRILRKAVGAENPRISDMDLSLLNETKRECRKLNLFKND